MKLSEIKRDAKRLAASIYEMLFETNESKEEVVFWAVASLIHYENLDEDDEAEAYQVIMTELNSIINSKK